MCIWTTLADGSDFRTATSNSSQITGARYISGWYYFNSELPYDELEDIAVKFQRLMKSEQARLSSRWTVSFAYDLAFDAEITRSVTGDIPLVAAAFTLTTDTTIITQYFRKQPYLSSATLGVWGMIAVALSVGW